MSNKISEETQKAVVNMFTQGASKAEIARKHNISSRSVGRIINESNNNSNNNEVKTITIPCFGKISDIDITTTKSEPKQPTPRNCVVQQEVKRVMAYVRREIEGIEALTYLLESNDTPENLEYYREALVRKLSAVNWWKMDVKTVKLGIHSISVNENSAIQMANAK